MLAQSALLASVALLSSLLAQVAAHGYVQSVTVGGKTYNGFDPNTDPYTAPPTARVIRKIPNDGPVTDLSRMDLACNVKGEAPSSLSADANAGDKVKWQWTTWPADHLGPVTTYMASCNGACKDLDLSKSGSSLKWFKIDGKGYDSAAKRWATEELRSAGSSWTSTVPANLASGEYLMRNEIVALHGLPAQSYPSCLQLKVKGPGSLKAPASETVSIPGLYNGFTWPDIWADNFNKFAVPGPAVVSLGGAGNDDNDTTPATTAKPAATTSKAAATTSKAAPTTSKAPATEAEATTSSKAPAATKPAANTAVASSSQPAKAASSTAAAPTKTRTCRRKARDAAAAGKPAEKRANVPRSHRRSRLANSLHH